MLNPTEMVLLLLGVVILVGGKKLPELGSGLGKGISEFKKAISGSDDEDKKQLPKEGEQKVGDTKPGEPKIL
jgi:sec-independent protein translocase protein TatA